MKLREIINSKEALINLLENSLPINISWELKKISKLFEPEIATFNDIRNSKIKEMGEETGDGNIVVKNENVKKFLGEIDDLLEKEINIIFNNIKDLLDYKDVNGKNISISASDLIMLEWLITE